jgi:hypothetical protein
MRAGGVGGFNVVPSLSGNGVITKAYLRGLEDAIRQRTPIAGANIDFKITDGGCLISSAVTASGGAGGGGAGFVEITLTVCSNGTPGTITVLGK